MTRMASDVIRKHGPKRLAKGMGQINVPIKSLPGHIGKIQKAVSVGQHAVEMINAARQQNPEQLPAYQQVRALESMLRIGETVSAVPGVGKLLNFQAEAVKAIGKGMKRINDRLSNKFAKNLLAGQPSCSDFKRKLSFNCTTYYMGNPGAFMGAVQKKLLPDEPQYRRLEEDLSEYGVSH